MTYLYLYEGADRRLYIGIGNEAEWMTRNASPDNVPLDGSIRLTARSHDEATPF